MENVKQGNLSLAEKLNGLLTSFVAQLQTKKFWIELFIMTAGMFVASISS